MTTACAMGMFSFVGVINTRCRTRLLTAMTAMSAVGTVHEEMAADHEGQQAIRGDRAYRHVEDEYGSHGHCQPEPKEPNNARDLCLTLS